MFEILEGEEGNDYYDNAFDSAGQADSENGALPFKESKGNGIGYNREGTRNKKRTVVNNPFDSMRMGNA